MGGIVFQVALTAQQSVTSCPLSSETIAPTCLATVAETIFLGFCTVVQPVSSTISIMSGVNPSFSKTEAYLLKKVLTLCLLKLVARLNDVLSGVLRDKLGCHFMKPESQLLSTFFASTQELGIFRSSLIAYSYASDFTSLVDSP